MSYVSFETCTVLFSYLGFTLPRINFQVSWKTTVQSDFPLSHMDPKLSGPSFSHWPRGPIPTQDFPWTWGLHLASLFCLSGLLAPPCKAPAGSGQHALESLVPASHLSVWGRVQTLGGPENQVSRPPLGPPVRPQ